MTVQILEKPLIKEPWHGIKKPIIEFNPSLIILALDINWKVK